VVDVQDRNAALDRTASQRCQYRNRSPVVIITPTAFQQDPVYLSLSRQVIEVTIHFTTGRTWPILTWPRDTGLLLQRAKERKCRPWDRLSRSEVPKLWGVPPGERCWFSGGGELFVWGAYLFWTKYGRKIKNIFWKALCLVEIFYLSLSTGTGWEL
jgi:hypothetical protein